MLRVELNGANVCVFVGERKMPKMLAVFDCTFRSLISFFHWHMKIEFILREIAQQQTQFYDTSPPYLVLHIERMLRIQSFQVSLAFYPQMLLIAVGGIFFTTALGRANTTVSFHERRFQMP